MGTMWRWGKYNVLTSTAATHEVCRHWPFHIKQASLQDQLHYTIASALGLAFQSVFTNHLLNIKGVQQFVCVMCLRDCI